MLARLGPTRSVLSAALLLVGAASSQAQVSLQLKHKPGDSYLSKTEVKVAQTMTIMGTEIPTSSNQTVTTRLDLGAVRDNGDLPILSTIESVKFDGDIQGNTFNYDSESGTEDVSNPALQPVVDALKSLLGIKYTLVLDKSGKVTAVEGTEAILEKARETNPDLAEGLKTRFAAPKIMETANEEAGRFPTAPVRPGETWTRKETQDLGSGQTFAYEKTYEYVGPIEKDGKTLEKINVKVSSMKFGQDPNANAQFKITGNDLALKSSEGTILFDPEIGRVVDDQEKQTIAGSLTLTIQGMELSASLELTMEQHKSTSPVSAKP